MKKKYLFMCMLFSLVIINFSQAYKFYQNHRGNILFSENSYTGALDMYNAIGNRYNMANTYYKMGDYSAAESIYTDLKSHHNHQFHNLGNTLYQRAKKEKQSISARLELLEQSLTQFRIANNLRVSDSTLHNIDLISEEIEALETALKNLDSKDQTEQENTPESQSGQETSDEHSDEGSSQEDTKAGDIADNQEGQGEEQKGSEKDSPENSSGSSGEESQVKKLPPDIQKKIDEYSQKLQQSQGEYGAYYNKVYKQSQQDLKDALHGIYNTKKDW